MLGSRLRAERFRATQTIISISSRKAIRSRMCQAKEHNSCIARMPRSSRALQDTCANLRPNKYSLPVMASPFNHFTSSWFISPGKKWLGKRGERILDSSASLFYATQLQVGEERERNILFKQFTCYRLASYNIRMSRRITKSIRVMSDWYVRSKTFLRWHEFLVPQRKYGSDRPDTANYVERRRQNKHQMITISIARVIKTEGNWQRRWQMKTKSLPSENISEASFESATQPEQIEREGEGRLKAAKSSAQAEGNEKHRQMGAITADAMAKYHFSSGICFRILQLCHFEGSPVAKQSRNIFSLI